MSNRGKTKICAITTISKTMDWFVVDSMKYLSENNYDITLICNMDNEFINVNSLYASCKHIPMKRGIDFIGALKSITRMYFFFKKEKFDIIYYSTPNASLYASIAGLLAGIKIRIYNQCGIRYVSLVGLKRYIFKRIEKVTCMNSTHIRSQSPRNREFALNEKLCKYNKISVVGVGSTIGVDLTKCILENKQNFKNKIRSKYQIPNDAFVFGYIGRINIDKGINELLKAFKMIMVNDPNSYLMLVGMFDESNPISKENIIWASNCNQVIFTGNVSTDEVYEYLASFDILTHPTYREGFGKVLQEAMGMELPIITTDVPGANEVIEDKISGFLVKAKDEHTLYNMMKYLKEDPVICQRISKAGRKRAETYFDRPIMLKNILLDMNKIITKKSLKIK